MGAFPGNILSEKLARGKWQDWRGLSSLPPILAGRAEGEIETPPAKRRTIWFLKRAPYFGRVNRGLIECG